MMEFTPITKEEFPESRVGRPGSAFGATVSALEIGDGFSTPCIWEHRFYQNKNHSNGYKVEICPGRNHVHQRCSLLRRQGGRHRFRTNCKDGTVYAIRLEDKEEKHDN